jgi:hypothetical protein
MFIKNYPHYPHKKVKIRWIILAQKRTDVLWSYNKNVFSGKKTEKNVDF